MIALEFLSMLFAIAALVLAFLAAKGEHTEAVDERSTFHETAERAENARTAAGELDTKGELLSVQGKQDAAQEAFRQRDREYRKAEELEASKEEAPENRIEKQVTLSRRAVSKALWAAGLGTASAIAGALAGIAGSNDGEASPKPTPSASR